MRCRVPIVRVLLSTALAVGTVAALVTAAGAPAQASTPVGLRGGVHTAYQLRDGSTTITGFAYDPAHSARSVTVCIWSRDRCQRVVRADGPRPTVNRAFHITGRHGYVVRLPRRLVGANVSVRPDNPRHRVLDVHFTNTPGHRAVVLAASLVGDDYRYGGHSPSGFDCSGLSMYVYYHAHVATLPHNSDTQRFVPHMHLEPRAAARPGDLVFYMQGSYAYHVAVYAGNDQQFAAATTRDGVRKQPVWSSDVQFRTDWH